MLNPAGPAHLRPPPPPYFCKFNPFSHAYLSHHHRLTPSSTPSHQGIMECVQVSGGFGVAETAGACTDDFFVDQLFDFSNALPTEAEEQQQPEVTEDDKRRKACSVSKEEEQQTAPPEDNFVLGKEDFGPLPETELPVPAISEDLESLEWLSHFVEDSFSDYSLTGKLLPNPPEPKVVTPTQEQPRFVNPVQTKARTKRARTGVRVWPVLSPSLTESPSTSSSSSTSSTTSFPPPPMGGGKKRKKSPAEGGQPRRCSHCGVTKTPQWRAGPLGSKTLCNACGVRYKSGRLLPEYRPACSPTFSSELHSNNHRRVLEMRRKKETETESKPAGSENFEDPLIKF